MRLRDYKRNNPPPKIMLPNKQIPDFQYHDYCLNGEIDIPKFLREYEQSKMTKEEKKLAVIKNISKIWMNVLIFNRYQYPFRD